jgi:hypothetical protein
VDEPFDYENAKKQVSDLVDNLGDKESKISSEMSEEDEKCNKIIAEFQEGEKQQIYDDCR